MRDVKAVRLLVHAGIIPSAIAGHGNRPGSIARNGSGGDRKSDHGDSEDGGAKRQEHGWSPSPLPCANPGPPRHPVRATLGRHNVGSGHPAAKAHLRRPGVVEWDKTIVGAPSRTMPLLAVILTACAHYSPAPLAEAPMLSATLPATADNPAGPLGVADVVALAVARDPDLVAARTKAGVAQAQLIQAGVLPNPSLTGALLPLVAGAGTVPAWNLGLAQDIKSLLVYKPKRRAARDSVGQVRADLLWQEWQVAGQARQLAVDIIAREQTRPLLDEAVRILGHRQRVTQAALAAGNATLVTAAPSAVGFQQARTTLQTLDQTQLQDRHKLNALLGLAPDAPLSLRTAVDLPPFDLTAARAGVTTLADRRPDLLALRFGYAAQDEGLRAAILSDCPCSITTRVTSPSPAPPARSFGPNMPPA
ncbi:hypothetical protein WR25_00347 [Diploscapter pachys]|uniref:TolC family protein n=1 Tax=Diploscapter pachys TaxID=2018661 RepID=A0A2A2JYX4_9BILA|nr:hypothetical protein WR25_00347 [Diploscapter pachys]